MCEIGCKRGFGLWIAFVIVAATLLLPNIQAQEYYKGYVFDSTAYMAMPYEGESRAYGDAPLPKAFSLRKYAPPVGDQGKTASCASWATAYAARSILMAIRHEQNRSKGSAPVYSAFWVYNGLRGGKLCEKGTTFQENIDILVQGAETLINYPERCATTRRPFYTAANRANAIQSYVKLSYYVGQVDPVKIKRALARKQPVVVAMYINSSMDRARGVWNPTMETPWDPSSGHGMTVVGYDDGKYGGSFEVMNSWGPKWGNRGYIWIRYADMRKYCMESYAMIDLPNNAWVLIGPHSLVQGEC